MLVVTDSEVEKLVPVNEVVEAVEKGYAAFSSGKVIMPVRSRMEIKEYSGDVLLMPCYVPEFKIYSLKIVTVYPKNVEKNLPTIFATVVILDPETGETLAVADGRVLTGLRTGAATAVGVKHLARRDSRYVGIIGCGYQAKWQLLALSAVMKPEKIIAYDIVEEKAREFVNRMSDLLECEVTQSLSPEQLVKSSDIVITVTTSRTPVVKREWVKPGTHISAIGAYTPEMAELDSALVADAKVVVDSLTAAKEEAGDIIQAVNRGFTKWEDVYAEIGEIILGKKKGRESDDEITIFKSVGLAVQDAAAAKVLLTHLKTR